MSNSLCLLVFVKSHQKYHIITPFFLLIIVATFFSPDLSLRQILKIFNSMFISSFEQRVGPFSWLPHILSRGNNGKWKPLCINGSVTPRESGGGGGDNKLRWKYSDGGALIITFQPLPSSQSHPGGYSLLRPIRCSALCILICWNIKVYDKLSHFCDLRVFWINNATSTALMYQER